MSIIGALIGSAIIGGGASLLAGNAQAKGASQAAALSAAAQDRATDEVRRQYDQTRTDLAPYRETGQTALQQYGAIQGVGREGMLSPEDMEAARGHFQETPGYQFSFDEGMRAMDASASAGGRLGSGGYGRELIRYGQGMANQQWDSYANRLAGLAGMGQNATNQGVAAGQQSAQTIGGIQMAGAAQQGGNLQNAATARASGYAGFGNAATGAANNYLSARAWGVL